MFSENTPFDATIHKNSRCSFSKPKTDAMDNQALVSEIWLVQTAEEKVTLAQVMEYRVTDEWLPLFNINGTMKKVQKSKLVEKLHIQPIDPVPDRYIALVDMGFL